MNIFKGIKPCRSLLPDNVDLREGFRKTSF
jgi:hypothetical protein